MYRGSIRFGSHLRAPHESITEQKDAGRREQDKMKSGRSERQMKRHTEINEMTKRERERQGSHLRERIGAFPWEGR
jgi:hypothetical protein